MVVKRFTNLGLVGRGGGGGESEEEMGEEEGERGEAVVEERDLITDNLGHIGRYVDDAQSDKPIPRTAANRQPDVFAISMAHQDKISFI